MVLFYTIIFSYWPSESCENFSCSENISFILHLSAVYLNIRFNKSMKESKDSTYKSWLCIQSNTALLRNIHFEFSQQHLSASTTGEGFYCHYLHGMAKNFFLLLLRYALGFILLHLYQAVLGEENKQFLLMLKSVWTSMFQFFLATSCGYGIKFA